MKLSPFTSSNRYNPFDPIQDTERPGGLGDHLRPGGVTTHSIRYRILKGADETVVRGLADGYNPFDPIQDTERLNRLAGSSFHSPCYNPFDPIQDTESSSVDKGPYAPS